MKKSLICFALAASIASVSVQAQEQVGGENAFRSADGSLKEEAIAATATAVIIAAAIISNGNASAPARVVNPTQPPAPTTPTCDGDDVLVDGVCVGNTVTTTLAGTGTGTNTSAGTGTNTGTVPTTPTCSGDDALVDGVCIGNTVTTTLAGTGTGTNTSTVTVTVPVTFTSLF